MYIYYNVSHICYNDWYYLICKLSMTFSDFEGKKDKNMFDLEFLNQYQAKLYFHLNQLFNEKKVPSATSSTKSTSIKRGI